MSNRQQSTGVGLLMVGLGNPGARYDGTRHNIGFRTLDRLAQRLSASAWQPAHDGLLAVYRGATGARRLLKPLTFMNHSGRSVRAAAAYFRVPPAGVLVAHDEIDLPLGTLKLKVGGGDAGNRGVRSIARELGDRDFARLRIGVGRPPPNFRGDVSDYVLQAFAPTEQELVDDLVDRACGALQAILERDFEEVKNDLNQRAKR